MKNKKIILFLILALLIIVMIFMFKRFKSNDNNTNQVSENIAMPSVSDVEIDKNQVEYNSKLRKALKADETLTRKEKSAQLKANRINPFTFITLVITIALVFASAFLIIIRSIKGLLELKKVKLFRISLFGTIVSLGLIMLPYIFKKQITEITYPSQYVNLFISCVSGSALCYYYFFGFLICLILSIIAKFAKRERKF